MKRFDPRFIFVIFAFIFGIQASAYAADNMTIFLKSCAYGTAAGAVVGLATLAVSENPSGKISNVARGASLGLYAGIGFGLYTLYGDPSRKENSEYSDLDQKVRMWLSPISHENRFDGAQMNWASFSF